jgi:outer membrane immunogenic protein
MCNKLISGLAGAAFSFAASGFGFAADMAVKAPPPAPPAPVYNWTGFYVGLNAGGGWGSNKIDNSFTPGTCNAGFCSLFFTALNIAIPGQFDIDPSGFIGGGQIGYNYQFASNWVAGLEADFQGANIKGDANAANAGMFILGVPNTFQVTGAASQKLDWFGTLRGRLGWTPTPPVLLYATGGLAFGHVQTNASFSGQYLINGFFEGSGSTAISQSDTLVGWTVGGGLEWMFAPRWSVEGESLC